MREANSRACLRRSKVDGVCQSGEQQIITTPAFRTHTNTHAHTHCSCWPPAVGPDPLSFLLLEGGGGRNDSTCDQGFRLHTNHMRAGINGSGINVVNLGYLGQPESRGTNQDGPEMRATVIRVPGLIQKTHGRRQHWRRGIKGVPLT